MKAEKCSEKKYIVLMAVIMTFLFLRFYDGEVIRINTTMFAFSYKYGFISRGLVGSIYALLDTVVPFDLMHYGCVLIFTLGMTILFYVMLLIFVHLCLKRCGENVRDKVQMIFLFFVIFAVPMFCAKYNFGRLDLYCVMLSLMGTYLLILGKAEWLVIPIAALGVMVHQGYVFMFVNILLVLLFYKAFSAGQQKKYMIIFVVTFLVVSVLFLYFELFSHVNGEGIYEEVVQIATNVGRDGLYHKDVIDKEILGIDLADREVVWYRYEIMQFPFFLLLMSPYIVILCKVLSNVIKNCHEKKEKMKYIAITIGAGTILPDLLIKVDFGRWMFSIICYYCVVILAVLAMGDYKLEQALDIVFGDIRKKYGMASYLLLVYPLLLQPLGDVNINQITAYIGQLLNSWFFHLPLNL